MNAKLAFLSFMLSVWVVSVMVDKVEADPPKFVPNYDESKVPSYKLPDILDAKFDSVEKVRAAWPARREELLKIFSEQMFGYAPSSGYRVKVEKVESGLSLNGKAKRVQLAVTIATDAGQQRVDLLIFMPANATKPVPAFLGLNFRGNHTVCSDEQVLVTQSWSPNDEQVGASQNKASAAGRGKVASRWPIELIVDAGFAIATAYCGDIDPDYDDGFNNGVHALFPNHKPSAEHPERWGTIAAWAWGVSRLLDAIGSDVPEIDAQQVAVIGHSRLGKTALWAGATDTRFAAVISNNSGCGGAALSRREFGETVGRINTSFPHWFCGNFKKYNENEKGLPLDQHQLLALSAPRKLYVASATEDLWADPRGEFLATQLAGQLYQRLGSSGLAMKEFPESEAASVGHVGYHLRAGKHDINEWDWKHYLEFMK